MIKKVTPIFLILLVITLTGCIEEDQENDDVWCLINYQNHSGENITGEVVIITEDNEVFNSTIHFNEESGEIYREKSGNGLYFIKVIIGNITEEADFNPNGQNALFVSVSPSFIGIQEVTD